MKRTRALLERIDEIKPVGARLVLGALVFPLVVLAVLLDAVQLFVGRARKRTALSSATTTCDGGHRVELIGLWRCGGCRFAEEGHAWERCRACGCRASRIECPCGRSILTPLPPEEDP